MKLKFKILFLIFSMVSMVACASSKEKPKNKYESSVDETAHEFGEFGQSVGKDVGHSIKTLFDDTNRNSKEAKPAATPKSDSSN
jgi:hypothetical protein